MRCFSYLLMSAQAGLKILLVLLENIYIIFLTVNYVETLVGFTSYYAYFGSHSPFLHRICYKSFPSTMLVGYAGKYYYLICRCCSGYYICHIESNLCCFVH